MAQARPPTTFDDLPIAEFMAPPLTTMRVDNVASGEPQPFGLTPTALEAVAPGWLGTAGPRAFYYPFRRHARR